MYSSNYLSPSRNKKSNPVACFGAVCMVEKRVKDYHIHVLLHILSRKIALQELFSDISKQLVNVRA